MFQAKIYVLGCFLGASFLCFDLLTAAQFTDPSEVIALRAIKGSLVDPIKHLDSWNKGDPCTSNWTGVSCFDVMGSDDGYVHVQQLQLLNLNLSGSLSPEIGLLSHVEVLILNGNKLSGSLPDEIGYLPNLVRLQVDQNHISGTIPKSFANLNSIIHLHLNNNSISGQIPPELSRLPNVLHFQLDNNHFDGSQIPASYGNMSSLVKLSLRNCSLQGAIPDFSRITTLHYLDLSLNQLTGIIPPNKLSDNVTTMSLENNLLSGSISSSIWREKIFNVDEMLTLDFRNNSLSNIIGDLNSSANVTLRLQGNPVCHNANVNIARFCGSGTSTITGSLTNSAVGCPIQSCPTESFFEYVPTSPVPCFCASPLRVGYRLKSPSFLYFPPYQKSFDVYMTSSLSLDLYQISVDSFIWEHGPRLRMYLKLFPSFNNRSNTFNTSEIQRIKGRFTTWRFRGSDLYGPYELLNFTLLGPYSNENLASGRLGMSTSAIVGIALGAGFSVMATVLVVIFLVFRKHQRYQHTVSRKPPPTKISVKIDGTREFTYNEMAVATDSFNSTTQIGHGGYGNVYKGTIADGLVVAIKRAQKGSLQGEREFLTEIELLSRLHHRNLVSLVGYCDEAGEQMLVYEFMPNGTLCDLLSARSKESLSFAMRLSIALGSAKGILYLHTEADPPIFHRDIKSSNILLDSKLTAKVADFGLSLLAPVPNDEGIVPGHISTIVKGTPGYLDPEYFLTHMLTDKSDVYSLGVVFLELLTGKPPISFGKNIVREVNVAYKSGMVFSIVDNHMGSYPAECIEKFVKLALWCCQDLPPARPSMPEVVRELESIFSMIKKLDTIFLASSSEEYSVVKPSSMKSSSSTSYVSRDHSSSDVYGSDYNSSGYPSITPR
ncbi:hypothetical protein GIB67_026601 [Kingdonia uniflora]|uniref:non-specific serine/threonine protein kinase n=1 Tax=Kingdonia uniflora TaxID=39325 RepID=A0A7J7NNF1_9MAGN|nr:hypothetical protein GIB67_026601 [Kingdonia uniflora]